MSKQEEITNQIFKDAFYRIMGQMEEIEKYSVVEDANSLTVSVQFGHNTYKNYTYRTSGVYSLEEMLRNGN